MKKLENKSFCTIAAAAPSIYDTVVNFTGLHLFDNNSRESECLAARQASRAPSSAAAVAGRRYSPPIPSTS